MSDYIPARYDSVMFPQAPAKWNRKQRYIVSRISDGMITFHAADDSRFPYVKYIEDAQALGMCPWVDTSAEA